jgi:hypothetical protein
LPTLAQGPRGKYQPGRAEPELGAGGHTAEAAGGRPRLRRSSLAFGDGGDGDPVGADCAAGAACGAPAPDDICVGHAGQGVQGSAHHVTLVHAQLAHLQQCQGRRGGRGVDLFMFCCSCLDILGRIRILLFLRIK